MWVITDKIADSPPWLHMQKLCQCLMLCLKVTMRWSVQLAYIYQNRMKIVQIMDSVWWQNCFCKIRITFWGDCFNFINSGSTNWSEIFIKGVCNRFLILIIRWMTLLIFLWILWISKSCLKNYVGNLIPDSLLPVSLSANLILHLISRLWFLKPERIVRSLCQFLPFVSFSF